MLDFKRFYFQLGVRKITDFPLPKIVDDKEIVFPVNTLIHWVKPNVLPVAPSNDLAYLRNTKQPYVVTITEYSNPVGRLTLHGNKIKDAFNKQRKGNNEIRFVPLSNTELKIPKNNIVMFNYGNLTYGYKYGVHPLNNLYKWQNSLTTVIDNITDSIRHNFILLDMPVIPVSLVMLKKYSSGLTRKALDDIFITPASLNLLELWKWLEEDTRSESMFSKIPEQYLDNVTLMLKMENRTVFLNMGVFASALKGHPKEGLIKEVPYRVLQKLFLALLVQMRNSSGRTMGDILTGGEANANQDAVIKSMSTNIYETPDFSDEPEIETIDILIGEDEDKFKNIVDEEPVLDEVELGEDEFGGYEESSIDLNIIDYDNLNEMLTDTKDLSSNLDTDMEILADNNMLPKKQVELLKEIILNQPNRKPFNDNRTLTELTTITNEELSVEESEITLPDSPTILDKTMLRDTTTAIDKQYITKIYEKDIIRSLYSMQNAGIIITDHEVTTEKSLLGETEMHRLAVRPLTGKPSIMKIKLPKINTDGTFQMSGNTYRMRKQRADIPIRKLDANKVGLSSYYGKLFITSATYKKDDKGFWFRKALLEAREVNPEIHNVVSGSYNLMDAVLPTLYTMIARYIKSFSINGIFYNFDYSKREDLISPLDLKLSDVETNGLTVIGIIDKDPILIDMENNLFRLKDGKLIKLDDIYTQLGIDVSTMPIEFATVKVFRERLPVGLLLAYYIGFGKLIKLLNAEHKIINRSERYKLEDDEYLITFKDVKYIFKRTNELATMVLGGLTTMVKYFKNINAEMLHKQSTFTTLFNFMELPILYVNEIKLLEKLFIDPATKTLLSLLKEPENFKGLLVRSCELLLDDNYKNPNDIEGSVIKGYERISGMIYKHIVNNVRDFENRNVFAKSKIANDHYAVWKTINGDSTTVLVDDLNPLAALKQVEDVTYAGQGGRTATTLNKESRAFHASNVGIFSEATKDSGDVGVTAYLSANPNITNARGMTKKADTEKDGVSSLISTVNALMPYTTSDDVKRSNFANIMASHVVPIKDMKVNAVRTGYESVLAYRVDEKFAVMSREAGQVIRITPKQILVKYEKSGETKYKLGTWSTKEEAGSSYNHIVITDLKENQKFGPGTAICYDKLFFEPDIFDTTKLVFKSGTTAKTMLIEDETTHEDSSALSTEFTKKVSTKTLKVKSYVIKGNEEILNIIKIGDKVKPNDNLFTLTDVMGNLEDKYTEKFSEKSLEILSKISHKSPKAKVDGVIEKIMIVYNGELEAFTKSVQALIIESDKKLARDDKNISGKVTNEYSINGKPLMPGQLEIKVYIDVNVNMGVGDKCIFANQLKSTIGEVFDYPIITEHGIKVEAVFGARSIQARIVNSPAIIGTTTTLLSELTKKAVELYKK